MNVAAPAAVRTPERTLDEVRLWWVPLDRYVPAMDSLLDDYEQARAAALVRPSDRERYVTAHAAMRCVLGRLLDVEPAQVPIAVTCLGRPYLPGAGIDFSLSHTRRVAVIATADDVRLGVDVTEQVPHVRWRDIVPRSFSAAEQHDLLGRDERDARDRCLAYWAAKEAWLKALGCGLRRDLSSFTVTLDDTGRGTVIDHHWQDESTGDPWLIQLVGRRDSMVTAIAVASTDVSIAERWLDPVTVIQDGVP